MSIATSITGGSGASNQLLDLLAVVANPDVYKAKLDALEEATAANKVFVEAIGPASEIVALREEAAVATQNAKDTLAQAQAQAEQMKQEAAVNASAVVTAAQAKADSLVAEATKTKNEAEQLLVQAQEAIRKAEEAQAVADNAKVSVEAQAQMLQASQEEADKALADAQALKADILAKHDAFIKGL